jgi:hypothetical protein
MTIAYDTFMRQYHATGSEKTDGYSRDAFTGLAPDEKEEVFKLLVTELPWSVEWLFFLDAARALPIVKDAEQKGRGDPFGDAYRLQAALVDHTGDLSYQGHMIDDYPAYNERKKPLVVLAINRTPANDVTIDFFKNLILTETNEAAVARASMYFLDSLDVANATQHDRVKYNRLLDALRSDDITAKSHAIALAFGVKPQS